MCRRLNDSDYCFSRHSCTAIKLGVDRAVFAPLIDDIETVPVRDDLKSLLRFVKKLTLMPARICRADAEEVFAAGWDEKCFHEAIYVMARFFLMNRLTLGHGMVVDEARRESSALNMSYDKPDD
ncbi:MAG: hypothetical protein QF619_04745 [Candidatus Binatia bacterium]|nr:hypothetical protein [Candidatus Binatia bacterium]